MRYLCIVVIAGFLFVTSAVSAISPVPNSVQIRESSLIRSGGEASGASQPLLLAAAGRPDASVARARIQSMGNSAVRVLRRTDISKAERQRDFRSLLRGNFQLHAIGILTLGRHRAAATPQQLREFDRLFAEFVLVRCSELLDQYTNESFKVDDVINAGKNDVAVRTTIVPERGEPTEVQWVMRDFNGRPQIIDVRVNNVSLVITQRDEFNSVIQQGGMPALLDRLRARVGHRSTQGPT